MPRQIALATIQALPIPAALLDDAFNLVGANARWRERGIPNFGDAINSDDLSHNEKAEIRSGLNAVFAGSRDECRPVFSPGVLIQDETSLVRIRLLDGGSRTAIVIFESDREKPNAVGSRLDSDADAEPALFETDLEGQIVTWSSGARELFNLNDGEVMSQHASLLFAQGSFDFPDTELVESLRKGRTEEMRLRLKRGLNSFFDGQIVIDIFTDGGGGARLTCEASVVANRQRAGALRRSEERLRYALEAGSDGIWDGNIRTDRVAFTSRVSEILGSSGGSEGVVPDVTPQISSDGIITMKIHRTITERVGQATSPNGTTIPIIDVRETDVVTRVSDGDTVVIAGLISDRILENFSSIPILGSLPLVGGIFRKTQRESRKTDMVILLSPRIITVESAPDYAQERLDEQDELGRQLD